ncbi:MAG: EF-Tu/IF-2/RF-3 family GTPase [Candidatus Sigynarchaeota archaeon]
MIQDDDIKKCGATLNALISRGNEQLMKHYSISFITTHSDTIAKKIGEYFGKKASDTDMVFYDGMEGENVFITVAPQGYPDKLKTLLQCLNIGDFQVLLVTPDDKLDALMGEMIVAMECHPDTIPLVMIAGITKANEYAVDDLKTKLLQIIKNTSLKDKVTDVIVMRDLEKDLPAFKQMIISLAGRIPVPRSNDVRVLIDAAFTVKGVGTVVLGVVKSGTFNANDMLEFTDATEFKNVIIKSIQMQDIDQKAAGRGDRVGLAIKGLKSEEISRDNMFVTKGSMKAYQEFKIKFRLSKFSKKAMDVKEKQLYHVAIEHQVIGAVPVKIEGGSEAGMLKPNEEGTVTFKTEKRIAFGDNCNWAIVVMLEKFSGRLRILGWGHAFA